MTESYQEVFLQEADELLSELEQTLLEMETCPDDAELVARAFRALHTVKGSGSMFGFDDVAAFTHGVETVFDRVRNGELPVTKALVDVALRAKDHIRDLIDGSGESAAGEALLGELARVAGDAGAAPEGQGATPAPADRQERTGAADGQSVTYRIRFRPQPGLLAQGTDPLQLLDDLRQLGPCRVVAQTGQVPPLDELDPESCYVFWDAVLTTEQGENAIRDVFIFVEDECELEIATIDEAGDLEADQSYKLLGEILVERGDLSRREMEEVVEARPRFGEQLVEQGVVPAETVASALVEQQAVRAVRKQRQTTEAAVSLRVDAAKLDILVDLVGELVIAQARLSQTAASRADDEFLAIAEDVERLTTELRDNTLNIRMVPIGTTFSRFRRLVRDLSGELGKEVTLVTEGADTELDKTVIEHLSDPLVHLIRNALDHGVETPEQRQAAGKPAQGSVRLSARHSGAKVLIAIQDDGAGLDPEVLRAKAVERGLIAADAQLTSKELYNLIFAAGFSTAKQVSSVSGRGVGMDVVKRAIDSLRGSIDIDSRLGEGTTVTVGLPLTLAIIEGLLVAVGHDAFVLPLTIVEECVELTAADRERAHGNRLVRVRDELVPFLRLRECFGADQPPPAIEQVVIAGVDGERFGFVVDEVIGQHQTVIKNLGQVYQDVPGLSGATILGDGRVALILDAARLAQGAGTSAGGG